MRFFEPDEAKNNFAHEIQQLNNRQLCRHTFSLVLRQLPLQYLVILLRLWPLYAFVLFVSVLSRVNISGICFHFLLLLLLNLILTITTGIGSAVIFIIKIILIKRKSS